jgi:hypothetical protein
MKDLATFEQSLERKKITSSEHFSQEVCLACCIEWLRAVICNYKSYQQSQSQDRMDLLRKRFQEIVSRQDKYSDGDLQGVELKQSTNLQLASTGKRQFRTTHMVNRIGGTPGPDDNDDWTIGADEDSLTAPKTKLVGVNHQEKLKAWKSFGNEIFNPGYPYHLILLKGKAVSGIWFHAIAAVSYSVTGSGRRLLVFDPNVGETEIDSGELGPFLKTVAERCEKNSTIQSVRYVRLKQGVGFSEYF